MNPVVTIRLDIQKIHMRDSGLKLSRSFYRWKGISRIRGDGLGRSTVKIFYKNGTIETTKL